MAILCGLRMLIDLKIVAKHVHLEQNHVNIAYMYICFIITYLVVEKNHLVCNVKYAGSHQDKYIGVYTRRIVFHSSLQIHNGRHQICVQYKNHIFNLICIACNILV